jgi:hypothetical protein
MIRVAVSIAPADGGRMKPKQHRSEIALTGRYGAGIAQRAATPSGEASFG